MSSLKPFDQFSRFHMGPSVEEILSIYSNGFTLSNKMAAMPTYGKTLKIFFSRTKKASRLTFDIFHPGCKVYCCSNDDPRISFDLFTACRTIKFVS